MSTADLYEDGFPHGTKEGYDRGCRGSACPGALEVGQTCATAKTRYAGDYAYQRRVDAGYTPEQIRDAERANAARESVERRISAAQIGAPAAPKPKPAPTPQIVEAPPAAQDDPEPDAEPAGKTIPYEVHGTHRGYWNGCRDIACPGLERVGKSCRAAMNEYAQAKKRERLERAAQAEPATPAETEEPTNSGAPDLTADELDKVTAFGLHQPEPAAGGLIEGDAGEVLPFIGAKHAGAEPHRVDLRDEIMNAHARLPQPQMVDALATVADHGIVIEIHELGQARTITITIGARQAAS